MRSAGAGNCVNGYSTAQFGKCHEVPVWQSSPMGPFDAWPTGSGFSTSMASSVETNQYYPAIYESTTPVEPGDDAGGLPLHRDMTDKAIRWVRQQKSLMADKPFFVYYAPGATHAPHHVRAEWSDRYKGRFDTGWDTLREQILARQKELGVIPPGTELTERHEEIPAWEDMPDQLKPVLARQMEVYAGFLEHMTITSAGWWTPSTTSACSTTPSSTTSLATMGHPPKALSTRLVQRDVHLQRRRRARDARIRGFAHRAEFGTPTAYNHFAVGWAHAMDTPLQWTKQVASHWGGTRNMRSCIGRVSPPGEIRSQFHHVIDVAPTVLEVAGLPEPTVVGKGYPAPDGGRQHGGAPSTRPTLSTNIRRSTSRCSVTGASITRAGPRSPAIPRPG